MPSHSHCRVPAARRGWRAAAPSSVRTRVPSAVAQAAPPSVVLEDKWLAKNLAQFQHDAVPDSLSAVRAAAWQALGSLRMPSTRNEEYRFTDISPLLKSHLVAATAVAPVPAAAVQDLLPKQAAGSSVVLVNGSFRPELSQLGSLPPGVYVGGLSGAPAAVTARLGTAAAARGGPFAVLNSAMAQDVLVVAVPPGVTVTEPLYLLHLTTGAQDGAQGTTPVSAPRLLLHAGQGACCSLIEDWAPLNHASSSTSSAVSSTAQAPVAAFTCAVAELFLEQDAVVSHGYAEREAAGTAHIKATLVDQAAGSSYSLTEVRLGGSLTRHDVSVAQGGPRTATDMCHFLLAGSGQLHDLHTKLDLQHPEGTANQLHKCIVTASTGKGVFDGNVKVGKLAQRTDAGQLSRNLLLVPKATVNVKPNLQIIADDVKCTHGCAVSDLSEEELFYFRARGISALAARQALVGSFGSEVTRRLGLPELLASVQDSVRATLATVDLAALQPAPEQQ